MNILAIGAHFDDIELGCGGTLAKHIAEGHNVYAYIATRSGYKSPNNTIVRTDEVANREGLAAMNILKVEPILGQFKTLEVEFNDELNIEILRIVEERSIDLVYSHWVGDVHHDHQAVAKAALHSCRHVQRFLAYRSNWYHSAYEFKGDFYVDISQFWSLKEKAVMAHESEINRTGERWIKFFRNEAENAGQRIGVPMAEVFEVVKWLW